MFVSSVGYTVKPTMSSISTMKKSSHWHTDHFFGIEAKIDLALREITFSSAAF